MGESRGEVEVCGSTIALLSSVDVTVFSIGALGTGLALD